MQKVLSVFGCFVLIFALCTGCSRTPQVEKKTFYAMNTTMEFTVYGSASLVDDAEALINSLEDELSVTKDTSEIPHKRHTGYFRLPHCARMGLYDRQLQGAERGGAHLPFAAGRLHECAVR